MVEDYKPWADIPPKSNRKNRLHFSMHLYPVSNLGQRFLKIIKIFKAIATRHKKIVCNFLVGLNLVCALDWLK